MNSHEGKIINLLNEGRKDTPDEESNKNDLSTEATKKDDKIFH
jgi:hypothetical protein